MLNINNLKDLEKLSNEDIQNKYNQILEDGFTLDYIDNEKSFYVGKPIGIQDFSIINFKNEAGETRQLCLFERNRHIELYKGSLKKLERNEKELINRNNIFLYQYIAKDFLNMIAQKGEIIDGIDIRNSLYVAKTEKIENITKVLNLIFKNIENTIVVEKQDQEGNIYSNEYDLKQFFLDELGATAENDNLSITFNDRLFYFRNMLENSVNEIFSETFFASDIENFRNEIRKLPNKNISSIINIFGHQRDFIDFILIEGNAEDLVDIISDTLYKKNGSFIKLKLSLTTCDAIYNTLKSDIALQEEKYMAMQKLYEAKTEEEIKFLKENIKEIDSMLIKSGNNRFLSQKMFAGIFSALNGETGIARGSKNSLKPEIVKFIIELPFEEINILEDLIKQNNCDPKKDKGNLIFQYIEAARNKDSVLKKEIINKNFLYNYETNFEVKKIEEVLSALGDKAKNASYFMGIINSFLHGKQWAIKNDAFIVEEYNTALRKKVKHEFKSEIITSFANKINDKITSDALKVASIIQTHGIRKDYKNEDIKVYIETNGKLVEPVLKFTSYDFSNFKTSQKKKEEIAIDFTASEKNNILESVSKKEDKEETKALDKLIKDMCVYSKKELDKKLLEAQTIILNDKFR